MAKRTVNIGLIGYKFMGKAHSNAYRQVARYFPDLEVQPVLKALCGRDPAGVARAADIFGWESCETDWRALLARPEIDIVDIAVPSHLHAEMAAAAAAAGKHVFCEKPLANSFAEARRMLEAVTEAGVFHAVWFNYRFVPALAFAKKLIDDGALGTIHHCRAVYLQDWLVNPNVALGWRLRKEEAGSGSHGDLLSHSLDIARFLVGEIREVSGLMETFVKERPDPAPAGRGEARTMSAVTVDDASLALARFAGGAVGTFEATRCALGRKNHNRVEINGSHGSIVFNMERPNELEMYTEDTPRGTFGFRTISVTSGQDPYSGHYWPTAHNTGYEHTFINLLHDALAAIGRGENPTPSFRDGCINNMILDTIERSAHSRAWETVPLLPG